MVTRRQLIQGMGAASLLPTLPALASDERTPPVWYLPIDKRSNQWVFFRQKDLTTNQVEYLMRYRTYTDGVMWREGEFYVQANSPHYPLPKDIERFANEGVRILLDPEHNGSDIYRSIASSYWDRGIDIGKAHSNHIKGKVTWILPVDVVMPGLM